jgi:hypothetical protein
VTFTYQTSRDGTPSVEAAVRGDSDILTTIITVTDGTVDDVTDDVDDNSDGFGPGFGVVITVAGLTLLSLVSPQVLIQSQSIRGCFRAYLTTDWGETVSYGRA